MVVRFHPADAERASAPVEDRDDLAVVIELRSRLAEPSKASSVTEGSDSKIAEVLPMRGSTSATQSTTQRHHDSDQGETAYGEVRQNELDGADDDLEAVDHVASDDCDPNDHDAHREAASDQAIRLLARRARSSGELRRELLAAGHAEADIEATVDECERSLYLDDLGLARVLTEGLRQKKRASRSQIRMKLRERLLPDWAIEQAVSELDDDEEHELLRQTATDRARKMTGLDRVTAERRLLGFLARRGWGGERAIRVVREALDNTAARGAVRFR